MANLQAIKDEILNNPASMPYVAFTEANSVANAEIMNNASGLNPRTVSRDSVESSEVISVTTYEAFDGLTASEEAWFKWITQADRITVNANTLAALAGVGGSSRWAAADRATMEPLIQAVMQYQGSRADEIRSTLGTSYVSPTNVRDAVNLV